MPDRYAVIGNPIGQSQSPYIHGQFAAACKVQLDYGRVEAPIGQFARAVDEFRAAGGVGLNVTAPFKLDAIAYASSRSPAATLAGAANALRFTGSHVEAENFDGAGLVRDVVHNLAFDLRGQRLLILGAGGAARGVMGPVLAEAPASVVIANRAASSAIALAKHFAHLGELRGCETTQLGKQKFDALFDATSASLLGQAHELPSVIFAGAELAYDLSYGKNLSSFRQMALRVGVATVTDGVGMLVEQAAETFQWWLGVRPETQLVIRSLRERLGLHEHLES